MRRKRFCAIDKRFLQNTKDNTAQEEPISIKKTHKGDAALSTQKFVLGWAIDTFKQVLTLPEERKRNLLALLDTIPLSASQCSWRRWHKLLGTLSSTVLTIEGAAGMSTRLQHALRLAKGLWINLSALIHSELTLCHHLVASLSAIPTHLKEIRPNPPTCIGATDTSLTGMGGVCYSTDWE